MPPPPPPPPRQPAAAAPPTGPEFVAAVRFGTAAAVRALLARGAYANQGDEHGITPLQYCAQAMTQDDGDAQQARLLSVAEVLLEAGANPTQREVMEFAEGLELPALLKLLVDHGASLPAEMSSYASQAVRAYAADHQRSAALGSSRECAICTAILGSAPRDDGLPADPCTAPCGHTFCLQCSRELARRGMRCSVCSAPLPAVPKVNVQMRDLLDSLRNATFASAPQPKKKVRPVAAQSQIPPAELAVDGTPSGLLGSGTYGTVRRARWKTVRDVAVKTLVRIAVAFVAAAAAPLTPSPSPDPAQPVGGRGKGLLRGGDAPRRADPRQLRALRRVLALQRGCHHARHGAVHRRHP